MESVRTAIVIALIVINALGIYGYVKLSPWNTFDGAVTGLKIEGDPSVPATKWYNHPYLAMWGWKTVAVFEAQTDGEYFYGYKPFEGDSQVSSTPMTSKRFKMKVGHEACTFFTVDKDGKEVALTLIERTTVDDKAYADVPQL